VESRLKFRPAEAKLAQQLRDAAASLEQWEATARSVAETVRQAARSAIPQITKATQDQQGLADRLREVAPALPADSPYAKAGAVEPFSGIPGSAHTLLSFEFENDIFVAISVEIRKEKGESYHPAKGLFDQYELMYVIGDEKDLIKLRANYRKDTVFLYPIKAEVEDIRSLFLDMIARTNKLKEKPEFYNTLTNTCTTNIVARRMIAAPPSPGAGGEEHEVDV
jgi:hypothetical protein